MTIEHKTYPYEILLRFNFDPAFGPLGMFRGAHYIEGEALEENGVILSFKPGDALPLATANDIQAYLGAQFMQVEAAYAEQLRLNAALSADLAAKSAALADHKTQLQAAVAARDAALADIAQARAASETAAAEASPAPG